MSAEFEQWFLDQGRKMVDLQKNDDGEYTDDRTHLMCVAYDTALRDFRGRRKTMDRRSLSSIHLVNERRKGERRIL